MTSEGVSRAQPARSHVYASLLASHVLALLMNGSVEQVAPWMDKLMDLSSCDEVASDETRAVANQAAGAWHAWGAGDREVAGQCFLVSRELLKKEGYDATAGEVACEHALTAYFLGRFDEAVEAACEGQRLVEATGRTSTLADIHWLRSLMHIHRGEWRTAHQERRNWHKIVSALGGSVFAPFARRVEALELLWRKGPTAAAAVLDWSIPLNQPLWALLCAERGDTEQAKAAIRAARGRIPCSGRGLLWLGAALPVTSALVSLESSEAEDWYPALCQYAGCLFDWFLVDLELARVAALLERWNEAEAHFGQAERLCQERHLRPFLGQVHYHRALMLLRRRAPGDRRRALRLLEEALSLFDALGLQYLREKARWILVTPARGRPVGPGVDMLTAREVAVLTLLAEGKSNREIAEQLFVSEKTVEHHLASIYAKLGVHGRSAAVAYALRTGLLDN